MTTLNRLNLLFVALHMPPVSAEAIQLRYKLTANEGGTFFTYETDTPVHDLIDRLDRHAGIITRFKLNGSLAPVGERLRRLERHIEAAEQPPYFWLGAAAEVPALTS